MLDAEQLTTILAEIEAQLNSRPLPYLGADPGDYSVITPAQILIGRNLQDHDGCKTRFLHSVQILGFLLMSAILIPVWGGLDRLFLLINWTKRKCYKEKAL